MYCNTRIIIACMSMHCGVVVYTVLYSCWSVSWWLLWSTIGNTHPHPTAGWWFDMLPTWPSAIIGIVVCHTQTIVVLSWVHPWLSITTDMVFYYQKHCEIADSNTEVWLLLVTTHQSPDSDLHWALPARAMCSHGHSVQQCRQAMHHRSSPGSIHAHMSVHTSVWERERERGNSTAHERATPSLILVRQQHTG